MSGSIHALTLYVVHVTPQIHLSVLIATLRPSPQLLIFLIQRLKLVKVHVIRDHFCHPQATYVLYVPPHVYHALIVPRTAHLAQLALYCTWTQPIKSAWLTVIMAFMKIQSISSVSPVRHPAYTAMALHPHALIARLECSCYRMSVFRLALLTIT
jgi:hypothetical protein